MRLTVDEIAHWNVVRDAIVETVREDHSEATVEQQTGSDDLGLKIKYFENDIQMLIQLYYSVYDRKITAHKSLEESYASPRRFTMKELRTLDYHDVTLNPAYARHIKQKITDWYPEV